MACVSKAMNMCRSLVTQLHMDICSIYGVWVTRFGLNGVLDSGVGIEIWIFGVLYIYVFLYIWGEDWGENLVIIALRSQIWSFWSDQIKWLFSSTSKWPFFFARIPTTICVYWMFLNYCFHERSAFLKDCNSSFKSIHQFPTLPLSLLHKQNHSIAALWGFEVGLGWRQRRIWSGLAVEIEENLRWWASGGDRRVWDP